MPHGYEVGNAGSLTGLSWHRQQQYALLSDTDHVVILGGSQSGKTTVGAGIVAKIVRREGPIYQRLRNRHKRPLKIWVCPQLHEKYLSHWERRLNQDVFAGFDVRYTESPHPVFTWDDSIARDNTVWAKSQEQGHLAFESDEVDLILFDEEPQDPRVYVSSLARLSATNGVIVFTFTPLMGLTWTHSSFYVPTVKDEYKIDERVWRRGNHVTLIKMGMADNPTSVEGGGVRRMMEMKEISEAERSTRLYGDYSYAEGLLLPEFADLHRDTVDSPYLLDGLPAGKRYSWVLTCDPNKRHGALLTAIDHEQNRYYCAEHYAEGLPDRKHAEAYRALLATFNLSAFEVGFYADPGGAGSQSIINMSDHGIYCQPVAKDAGSVKASIDQIRGMAFVDPTHHHPVTGKLGAPRVYFLRSLVSTWREYGTEMHESRLMWEFRRYRQKEDAAPGTPIKEHDDVVDCARYLELVRPYTAPPDPADPNEERARLDSLSRQAHDSYDEAVDRFLREQRTENYIEEL